MKRGYNNLMRVATTAIPTTSMPPKRVVSRSSRSKDATITIQKMSSEMDSGFKIGGLWLLKSRVFFPEKEACLYRAFLILMRECLPKGHYCIKNQPSRSIMTNLEKKYDNRNPASKT